MCRQIKQGRQLEDFSCPGPFVKYFEVPIGTSKEVDVDDLIGGVFIPHLFLYDEYNKNTRINKIGGEAMKGYTTESGYMGYVNGDYQLFASEADYREWLED